MDHRRKFYLLKQSPVFCSVPWNHFKIDTNGDVRTCINGGLVLGNIQRHSIRDIMTGELMHEIRVSHLADQPHANCVSCYGMENQVESGQYRFLRQMYNDYFTRSKVDYADAGAFTLSGVDLHWGSTCNLKCITCWAVQSSAIASEQRLPIMMVPANNAESVIAWLLEQQNDLSEIYFSGGEPTLIRHNLRLLQSLRDRPEMLLRVNTNMTFDQDNAVIQELLRFSNVLITASADGIRDRFEYMRSGASWSTFVTNLERLRQTHFKWRLNSVFFVASALYLTDTQDFFREQFEFSDFTVNQCVMDKDPLRCRNLPTLIKPVVQEKLQQHLDRYRHDVNLCGQLTNCLRELHNEADVQSYHAYLDDIDRRRGTDWRSMFAELA